MPVAHGTDIKGIITHMYDKNGTPAIYRDYRVMVEVNGEPVSRDEWGMVPAKDDHVLVYVPVHGGGGGGGKDPMRTLLTLAVVVTAIAAPWGIAAFTGGNLLTFAGMGAAATTSMYSGIALTSGLFLLDAFCPVSLPSVSQPETASPSYSIAGARNQMKPFGEIPVLLGTEKVFPIVLTQPWIELVGDDEYLRMAFLWGYGRLSIGTIYIGDTPITSYADCTVYTYEGLPGDAALALIPYSSHNSPVGVELVYQSPLIRSAPPGVDSLTVQMMWPAGIGQNHGDGPEPGQCEISIYFKKETDSEWTHAGVISLPRIYTTKTMRRGITMSVDRDHNYQVMAQKATPDGDQTTSWNAVVWVNIQAFRYEDPVTFPYPLAITEIRIKASQQLNGIIDSLNAVCSSYAPIWNGSAWTEEEYVTNNPAALFRKVLTHPANPRPRTAAQIDNAGLGAWYEFCVANGYKFNQYRDSRSSVRATLAAIAFAGRASPALVNGKWGVIVDTGTEPVAQHITPRNSWGFSAEKTFFERPHAFRVRFRNEENNYEWDERIVYDDGYNASNATKFESIEFPGITSPALAWKFGRYHIAQARLRPETYYVYQGWEHLVVRRGSKVRAAYDVPLWGSGWARVKSVTLNEGETHITGVILDDKVVMEAGKYYGCRFRLPDEDNTSLYLSVNTVAGETDTLTFATAIPVATGPAVNDLAMFGEANRETAELLVKEIQRASDYSARLVLVDEAPAIYQADQGPIPPFDPHITRPVDITKIAPGPPVIINIRSGTECLEIFAGGVRTRVFVSLYPPEGNVKIGSYRVRYKSQMEDGYRFADAPPEDMTVILSDVTDGDTYEIAAQAISIYGAASPWSETVQHFVIGQDALPSNVTGFACNIIDVMAHLSWTAVPDADLSHYRIRWSPSLSGASWANAVDVVDRVGKPATTVTVPAMVGTYFIKAVDFKGLESETAGSAITNIAAIAGLNVVETVEQPAWDGTASQCEYSATYGGIVLSGKGDLYDLEDLYTPDDLYLLTGEIYASGTYTLADTVDLGAVYTSRLSAGLTISGQDLQSDLYDIADLYAMGDMYGAPEGSYSAGLEVRTTEDDTTSDPTWSDWKPFVVGDYKARGFQFRIALKGTLPATTPIVEAVYVSIDMPDRVIGFSDTVPAGGKTIAFSPAFYELQGVGISVSDGAEGDVITKSETESGLTIAFTNGGAGVERNISGIAKGYGELSI